MDDQSLSLIYLIKVSWQTFKLKWMALLKIQLIGYLAMIIAAAVIGVVALLLSAIAASSHIVITAIIVAAIAVGVVALLQVSSWIELAQVYSIADRYPDSLRAAWPRALGLLSVALLSGLATLGGFLLLIIPGVIIWVWFSQSQYVYALEDLSGKTALSRSRQLVKGRWWKTFGLLILPSAALYSLSSLVTRTIELLNIAQIDTISAVVSVVIGLAGGLYIFCYSYHLFVALSGNQSIQPVNG